MLCLLSISTTSSKATKERTVRYVLKPDNLAAALASTLEIPTAAGVSYHKKIIKAKAPHMTKRSDTEIVIKSGGGTSRRNFKRSWSILYEIDVWTEICNRAR